MSESDPFLELCKLADKEGWCWNIMCTTCHYGDFRFGLAELARGNTPESKQEWAHTGNVIGRAEQAIKQYAEHLYVVCAATSVRELACRGHFPSFLGYMGLVLREFEFLESHYKVLSRVWGYQLRPLVDEGSTAARMLDDFRDHDRRLRREDLEIIESGFKRELIGSSSYAWRRNV